MLWVTGVRDSTIHSRKYTSRKDFSLIRNFNLFNLVIVSFEFHAEENPINVIQALIASVHF